MQTTTSLLALALLNPLAAGSPQDLVAKARQAAGIDGDETTCLRLSGTVTYLGVDEAYVADHALDGRFRRLFQGELEREVRFDGEVVRRAEHVRIWEDLALFAREVELLRAWVHAGYWLDPKAPLLLEPEEGGIGVRVEGGRLQARIELDERGLVASLAVPSGNGTQLTKYSDHAEYGGRLLARRVSGEMSLGSPYVFVIEGGQACAASPELFGDLPDEADFHYDPEAEAEVELVRAPSKHLFVRARVNGEDLGLFLFDTGAGFSGISAEAADALGLDSFGKVSYSGLGGEVQHASMRRAKSLQIGSLVIENLVFTEVPVERKSRMVGERVAGVLGWDVMRRAIVDLEPRGKLWLYDPAMFEEPELRWQPLTLHYKVPYLRSSFGLGDREGEGLFMVDCGAAGISAMFFHGAAEALGLLEGELPAESTGHGAGGAFQHVLKDIPWFELAGDRFDEVSVLVSTAPDGEADPYSLGLVGGGLLRNYRLVFDYANHRMAIGDL